MSATFTKPTSRVAISTRIADRQHNAASHTELISFDEREDADVPFTKDEARVETFKWLWLH